MSSHNFNYYYFFAILSSDAIRQNEMILVHGIVLPRIIETTPATGLVSESFQSASFVPSRNNNNNKLETSVLR